MSRIELSDTNISAINKLAEGNPGAINVIAKGFAEWPAIDPDSSFGAFGVIMALDVHEVYGCDIWMLYKDVCGQNMRVMCAVLRACQLGFLSDAALHHAIQNRGEGIDVPALVKRVEDFLPNFQREPVSEAA